MPEIAYLCPESQCAKNQRNGPCGGTRQGFCEVGNKECIWCRGLIRPEDPKVVYGVGSVLYLRPYHVECAEQLAAVWVETNDNDDTTN